MKQIKLGELRTSVTGGAEGDGGGNGPVVVLLHGFGAPGDDLVPLSTVIEAPAGTRFVFPEAPLALGPEYMGGRAWWNINLEERIARRARGDFGLDDVPNGLDVARQKVIGMLDAIDRELHPSKLVLGGFSQGAMLSLDVALHDPRPLAGLVLMSGTHIAALEWAKRFSSRKGLPIFMSHGKFDELLPFHLSEALKDTLSREGIPVDWVTFPGGHGIPQNVIQGIGEYLTRALGS